MFSRAAFVICWGSFAVALWITVGVSLDEHDWVAAAIAGLGGLLFSGLVVTPESESTREARRRDLEWRARKLQEKARSL